VVGTRASNSALKWKFYSDLWSWHIIRDELIFNERKRAKILINLCWDKNFWHIFNSHRIWKNLSWLDGRRAEVGLVTECSLMIWHHSCILSLVFDDCLSDIRSVNFLLATINTKLKKKNLVKWDDRFNFSWTQCQQNCKQKELKIDNPTKFKIKFTLNFFANKIIAQSFSSFFACSFEVFFIIFFVSKCFFQSLEPNRNRTQNPGSCEEPNPNWNPKNWKEPNPKEPGFFWVLPNWMFSWIFTDF
jgi:hypothetical protein